MKARVGVGVKIGVGGLRLVIGVGVGIRVGVGKIYLIVDVGSTD